MEQALMHERIAADALASRGALAVERWKRARDCERSDRYISAVAAIVGPVQRATLDQDMRKATDLVCLACHNLTLAVRVQFSEKAFDRPDDFTLRLWRARGAITEVPKILCGWCDWYMYAHARDDGVIGFRKWTLLDLDVFRAECRNRCVQWRPIDLRDGTHMVAFDMRHFSSALIVAQG